MNWQARLAMLLHREQVTAILVLFGLPWLLTGSILAHETMHAWLRLSGISHLPADVEEGLAQLMALLWLEHQAPDPVRTPVTAVPPRPSPRSSHYSCHHPSLRWS